MTTSRRHIITFGLLLANIMAGFEGTIISTAMPTIVSELHGLALMNWVYAIYFLLNAIGTPLWGKIADRIGRKRSFMIGTSIFVIGSLLEGMSPNMLWMIGARAIMGIGAGGMISIPFVIFAELYPAEQRAGVFGLTTAFGGISSVVGPLLGGWIVDALNWHWVFYINVPIGILSLLIVGFTFHETVEDVDEAVDFRGGSYLSLGLLSLLLGIQQIGQHAGVTIWSVVALVATIVFGFLFVRAERTAEDPIIPLHLFKNREMLIRDFMAFAGMGFYISYSVYVPMWAQGLLMTSALVGGATQIPTAGLWYGGSQLGGILLKRRSSNHSTNIALLMALIGSILLLTLKATPNYWLFIIAGAIFGIALGILMTTSQVAVSEAAAPEDLAVATTLNRLFNALGQTVMTSLYGLVFNAILTKQTQGHGFSLAAINQLTNPKTARQLPAHQLPAMRRILFSGIHGVMWTAFGLLVISLLLNWYDSHANKRTTMA